MEKRHLHKKFVIELDINLLVIIQIFKLKFFIKKIKEHKLRTYVMNMNAMMKRIFFHLINKL